MRHTAQTPLAIGSSLAIAILILNAVMTYGSLRALADGWKSLAANTR